MKKAFFVLSVLLTVKAFACDPQLQKFPRDCQIQDRYLALRERFAKKNIDITDIAEYKVPRLILKDRWDYAKTQNEAPADIYSPAPTTWNVWDQGLKNIFADPQFKTIMARKSALSSESFSRINIDLLSQGGHNVKNNEETSSSMKLGEYRTSSSVGFCVFDNQENKDMVLSSEASMQRMQNAWEKLSGKSLNHLVSQSLGIGEVAGVTMRPGLSYSQNECDSQGGKKQVYILYTPSDNVYLQIKSIEVFIQENLELYKLKKPILSPIQLATFVQKWMVTVHPFSDGNGRTSRGVQDIILAYFNMPFIPGGYLQDDATSDFEKYLAATYQTIDGQYNKNVEGSFDGLLAKLENCAEQLEKNPNQLAFECKTTAELNKK